MFASMIPIDNYLEALNNHVCNISAKETSLNAACWAKGAYIPPQQFNRRASCNLEQKSRLSIYCKPSYKDIPDVHLNGNE